MVQHKGEEQLVGGTQAYNTQLSLVRLQDPRVQQIVMPFVKSTAWYSHSEAVLQAMLCSSEKEEREFAVKKIMDIRDKRPLGSISVRSRRLPQLQIKATELKNMIDWSSAHEPLLSCYLSEREVKEIKEVPMVVPYYCLHTQGIERAVKEVTEASEAVYGFDRRDGFIRARANHRELMPVLHSKKDLKGLFQ